MQLSGPSNCQTFFQTKFGTETQTESDKNVRTCGHVTKNWME